MKCAEVHPKLGGFVLGGLEPDEAAEVRRHLASCRSCQGELREFEEVSQVLKAAPPPTADPPSYLKDAILSQVRAEQLASSSEELLSSGDRGSKIPRFMFPTVAASALVAIVALGIFFGWQAESPVVTVQLVPTPELREELKAEGEDYWGVAELHPRMFGNQDVELKLNNLEEPSPGDFYELWFVSEEKYVSAGGFTTEGSGTTNIDLTAPPEAPNYRTLLITEESSDNQPAPSEKVILRGEMP